MAVAGEKAAQLVKNNRLFIAVWENKTIEEKKANVEKYLKLGANVNASNLNFKNNTPLHIAVRRGEIEIIKLLLESGADPTIANSLDENALDIAKTLQDDVREEIVALLEKHQSAYEDMISKDSETESEVVEPTQNPENHGPPVFETQDRNTGVRGHLYETKLLSLVLLRAANDKDIEDYYLASNMAGIGVFDDICFKYNVKGRQKSIRLFLQAKHRDIPKKGRLTVEDVLKPDGEISLGNCFDSFLQIKMKLDPKNSDKIFGESYENVELHFIIYTSGEENFNRKLIGRNERSPKIHNLIYTGGKKAIFQFDYNNDDIYRITRDVQRMRIKRLALNFIESILGEKDKYQRMMDYDLIRKYHCLLTQTAIRICSVEKNHITAEFRSDFFLNTDPLNVLLRDELCKVMVEKCCIIPTKVKDGIVKEFKELPKEPSSDILSKFIGTVIMYDAKNNRMAVLDNVSKRGLKSNDIKLLNEHLKQIHANPTVIAEAIIKAGKQKLLSTKFKLPPSFGNIDMTIKGDKRMAFITSIFKDLFEIYKDSGEIIINECDIGKNIKPNVTNTLTEGFLGHNGGIGGAVGNLLLYDEYTNKLKFNTARPQSENAYALLEKLEKVVPQGKTLSHYRIKVNTYNFPRAAFSNDEYDNEMAKIFLNRLWFYTNQGKENEVEISVKKEIDKYYTEHRGRNAFRFRTYIDSIYSTFHNELQKWWMVSTSNSSAFYLTSEHKIFRIAQEGVVESPLLTLHNQMYLNILKKTEIEFISESVENLKLDEHKEKLINIKTDCEKLTAIKIQQHYSNNDNHQFIDFDYLLTLPPEDRNAIFEELNQTSIQILIVVCGLSEPEKQVDDVLNQIINEFKGNKIIVVTRNNKHINVNLQYAKNFTSIEDQMNDFIYFDEHSQNKFSDETVITFQGEEILLKDILDNAFKKKINAKMLSKLTKNERIEIGHAIMDKNYEDIREFYVPRRLTKEGTDDVYPVNSLDDIEDQVVLLITKHGMGKSSLLTHVALESKRMNPTRWIVRINLPDIMENFLQWQTENTKINKANVLMLLCIESLNHVNRKTIFQFVERDNKIICESNDDVDGIALLEMELFLHYYNERKITFLFYGFDYVCPPFGSEAIKLLKIIKEDGVPMWIASHSVTDSMKILKKAFGDSYDLQTIDETGQQSFFNKFWRTNVHMEKINSELCSNISGFIDFLFEDTNPTTQRITMPWVCMPLHLLYLFATNYFETELSNISFENINRKLQKHLKGRDLKATALGWYMDKTPEKKEAAELAGTPLFMYVAAKYFACKFNGRLQIEADVPEIRKKWDIWTNAVELYERFLQYNMNKVCRGNLSHLDEDNESDKRKDFFERHKKLALLAICKEEDLSKLLPAQEIEELKNTMNKIRNGEEKSALVDCVIDGAPKFFNLMYAEFAAVQILTDVLKISRNDSNSIRLTHIWDFIVNILLYSSSNSVRSAFDYMLVHDPDISELTAGEQCRNAIFQLVLKENKKGTKVTQSEMPNSLQTAVGSGMNNLVKLLLVSIETNLTEENIPKFTKLLQTVDVFALILRTQDVNAPTNFTDFFTDMKLDRVVDVLRSEHALELPMAALSFFVSPNVVDKTRAALDRARRQLVENATNNFGLSQENVEIFQRLAETIRRNQK